MLLRKNVIVNHGKIKMQTSVSAAPPSADLGSRLLKRSKIALSVVGKAVAALCVAAIATAALAQEWAPPGPIKMIIAPAAGGGGDTQARLIAEEIEAAKGWKIIPEQVTGKGGVNAVLALSKEPADGTAIALFVSPALGYNLRAAKAGEPDIATPITTISGGEMAVVALTSAGYRDIGDVIDAAKTGKAIRFGVMSPMLADIAYLLGRANGVEFNIVQLRGGRGVMDGLNAGDIDVGFGAGIQAKAVKAGDMIELASAKNGPLANSPDAPLLSDFGVKFYVNDFFMFAGPKEMDPTARDAIAGAISEVLKSEGSKAAKFINKAFGGIKLMSGAELEEFIAERYGAVGDLMAAASN